MGDGRYYTNEQFFTIIFLTLLIIFQVVTWMMYYFKSEKNKPSILMMSFYIGIILSALVGFYSELVVGIEVAKLSGQLSIGLIALVVLLQVLFILYKNLNGHTNTNKIIDLLHLLFLLLVLAFQFYSITTYQFRGPISQKVLQGGVLIMITLYYIIRLHHQTPYRVGDSIFKEVKNQMPDYVWIVDEVGNVIYKNLGVVNDQVFTGNALINIEVPETMFSRSVEKKSDYERSLYYEPHTTRYFTYMIKHLLNKGHRVGSVITIKEVTQTIKQLNKLKAEQESASHLNQKLQAHKGVVYEMEKEKEINELLALILKNQQEGMLNLKKQIEKLLDHKGEISDNHMDVVLDLAKRDLTSVRNTVNMYLK